ncbi:DUF6887 family protein [Argonema antarcticum]|uniref:DUF6887 family protein n=1 Tax=Argonema antarcticum TaxID=2942763 RepID=UPI0020117F14|nr:hypothetical protein [Argonema antarcticum]MCL1474237.1 hypothetical protein [Argonema antarcticum A004/B2]
MTAANYDAMSLNELRRYVLTYREDIDAFHKYIDRSKAAGRMIVIDLEDVHWEENITDRILKMTPVEGESEES